MISIYQNSMGDLVATDKEVPELEVIAHSNEYGITDRPLKQEVTLIKLDLSFKFMGVYGGGLFDLPFSYGIFRYIDPKLN